MASAALSEPNVLAHAKRRLFPDPEESDAYSVVDTQFATAEWLPGQSISPDVRGYCSLIFTDPYPPIRSTPSRRLEKLHFEPYRIAPRRVASGCRETAEGRIDPLDVREATRISSSAVMVAGEL